MQKPERHYIHGDPVEGDPGKFYCAKCDWFVEREHFDGCRLSTKVVRGKEVERTHRDKYREHRGMLLTRAGNPRPPYGRYEPKDDPGNLFR